jgi:hypothetical protein
MTNNKNSESEPEENPYIYWIEQGWWTSKEALCVFLGESPDFETDIYLFHELTSTPTGLHIQKIVNASIRDGSIKNHVIEPQFWSNRAPCKDWLEWALSKPSIHLDPLLLEAAGISHEKNPRTDESYRPKDEKMIKLNFLSLAKLILYMCPKARLKDIIQLIESSSAIIDLPSDRLKEERISLFSSKQTDDEITEIQKKLKPLLQGYSPFEALTQYSES